jgi:hypothetical protein
MVHLLNIPVCVPGNVTIVLLGLAATWLAAWLVKPVDLSVAVKVVPHLVEHMHAVLGQQELHDLHEMPLSCPGGYASALPVHTGLPLPL